MKDDKDLKGIKDPNGEGIERCLKCQKGLKGERGLKGSLLFLDTKSRLVQELEHRTKQRTHWEFMEYTNSGLDGYIRGTLHQM